MSISPKDDNQAFSALDSSADGSRSGLLKTRISEVKTPLFMPVATRGAVKILEPPEVETTGAQILLSNTYHLHLQPGEKSIERQGGLRSFNRWEGPILTDSGGFQVFSLAHSRKISEEGVEFKDPKSGDKVFMSPETSMQIQMKLGSDIIMAFDDLTGLSDKDKHRTKEAFERTNRWLKRCVSEFKKLTKGLPDSERPLLFGIVQGGLDKDLRRKSLDFVQSQQIDGVAIGGLSVGEPREDMHEILSFLAPFYDPAKVRYLMGVGEPVDMHHAIKNGIDMFDCVLPTRNARHGTVWVTDNKKLNLKNQSFAEDMSPIDKKCDCHTCKTDYSRAFLRQLFRSDDPLGGKLTSIHNLRYLQRLCESYR